MAAYYIAARRAQGQPQSHCGRPGLRRPALSI